MTIEDIMKLEEDVAARVDAAFQPLRDAVAQVHKDNIKFTLVVVGPILLWCVGMLIWLNW